MLGEWFDALTYGKTPSRRLNAFLEVMGTGPKLPTTEELARPHPKLPEDAHAGDGGSRAGDGGEG